MNTFIAAVNCMVYTTTLFAKGEGIKNILPKNARKSLGEGLCYPEPMLFAF